MLIQPAMGMYTCPRVMQTQPAAGQRASGLFFQNVHPSILPFFHMNFAHKYVIFMKGDTLDEMAEEALHYAYIYVMRALQEHQRQGRNGEYEAFALQLLAMLQKYRYLYTNPPEAPAPD